MERCRKKKIEYLVLQEERRQSDRGALSKRRIKDSGKFKEVTEQLKVAASQTEFDEI